MISDVEAIDVKRYRVGVDVGGTFTDFAVMAESNGEIRPFKLSTTPARPSTAVMAGLKQLVAENQLVTSDIGFFVHGTTLATNTIIERRGAVTGLLVTEGFRDVLSIARLRLEDPFDFRASRAAPLVPRHLTRGVRERVKADGTVLKPVDEARVVEVVRELVSEGVEAIAVALLNSYRNPAHEAQVCELIAREFPELYVSASSQIWPQVREYERTLVAVMNAYVGKRMSKYFEELERGVREVGVTTRVFVTKSNGGIMALEAARRSPVELLLSGPAAGVVGAKFIAGEAGFRRLITLDIGGTSADLSIVDSEPLYSSDAEVGEFPVTLPSVDITAIGAGGGSIAWVDSVGVLKVGPQSAGADPGPACYGRGSSEPTITDAYVVLGIIHPQQFLGGSMTLNPDLARNAVSKLCEPLGRSVEEVAEAILTVATSNMYRDLVSVLARRGIDPSDFVLFPYGGAGATHSFMLAEEAGFDRVVVPTSPGVLCACGALVADVKSDFIRTVYLQLDPENLEAPAKTLHATFGELGQEAAAWIDDQDLQALPRELRKTMDLRYLGQSFEIQVPVDEQYADDVHALERVLNSFHILHDRVYGYSDPEAPVEVINVRTTAVATTKKPSLAQLRKTEEAPSTTERDLYYRGRWHNATVAERGILTHGHRIKGPAIVEQYDTTTFIPTGWGVDVDSFGNLIGAREDET